MDHEERVVVVDPDDDEPDPASQQRLLLLAGALRATAPEMRDAGCSAREIMAARPRDVLRSLPDPHLRRFAATTMAQTGHDHGTVAGHLVAHAPTADAFAAGLTSAIQAPASGLDATVRRQAGPDLLAATSARYGLRDEATGNLLLDAGCTPSTTLDTLAIHAPATPTKRSPSEPTSGSSLPTSGPGATPPTPTSPASLALRPPRTH